MSSSVGNTYRCRGLRKWCSRRCEATSQAEPAGWPTQGYYCGLHSYQRPRVQPDGSALFESPELESHIRRQTSFAPPEAALAAELMKAPGIVRDRPGGRQSATGQSILAWLMERRLDADAARAAAQRMLQYEVLVPLSPEATGSRTFASTGAALYRVQPMPPPPAQPR